MTEQVTKIRDDVTGAVVLYLLILMTILAIVMLYGVSTILMRISTYITEPIIDLNDRINSIIRAYKLKRSAQRSNKLMDLTLSYRPRNKEVNQLYLAFSNLLKTI
jgi:hypothetical protein